MPDCDFIGAEPFINGVASLLRHIDEQQLGNPIWPDDVRLILPTFDTASLAGALSCFLIHGQNDAMRGGILQPAFLDQLATIIRPGANWCSLVMIQRQKVGYCRPQSLILALFGRHGAQDWRQRPADLPETRYMKKAYRANGVFMVSVSPM